MNKNDIKSLLPNPVKKAVCTMLRPIAMPPKRFVNLLAFQGSFNLSIDNKNLCLTYTNRWIENDLYWKGIKSYEGVTMDIWRRLVKDAQTIIDVGANTGLFSLVAKTVNPSAEVYGFEPLQKFRDIFIANCVLNNYDIRVDNHAMSDYIGQSVFYVPQENQGNEYSSSLSKEHYFLHQPTVPIEVSVDVTTFDAFSNENSLGQIDLVKIDAEGHDLQVLRGMKQTIQKNKPDFFVEVHSDEVGLQVMELLPPDYYSYFNINEIAGAKAARIITRSDSHNFLICKHKTAKKLSL